MVGVFQFARLNSFMCLIENQQIYFDKNTQYPYFLISEQITLGLLFRRAKYDTPERHEACANACACDRTPQNEKPEKVMGFLLIPQTAGLNRKKNMCTRVSCETLCLHSNRSRWNIRDFAVLLESIVWRMLLCINVWFIFSGKPRSLRSMCWVQVRKNLVKSKIRNARELEIPQTVVQYIENDLAFLNTS